MFYLIDTAQRTLREHFVLVYNWNSVLDGKYRQNMCTFYTQPVLDWPYLLYCVSSTLVCQWSLSFINDPPKPMRLDKSSVLLKSNDEIAWFLQIADKWLGTRCNPRSCRLFNMDLPTCCSSLKVLPIVDQHLFNVSVLVVNGQNPTQRSSQGYTTYMCKLIWAVRLQQRARPQLDYPPSPKLAN